MSYEFNSKLLGVLTEDIANKWKHPEFANNSILLFSGIHKHAQKHFDQFALGEQSKNYTMKHLREVINEPEYVSYSVKNNGFVFYKKLMEYVAVTIKPTRDYPDVFCISTIHPSSYKNMMKEKRNEQKIMNKIDEKLASHND